VSWLSLVLMIGGFAALLVPANLLVWKVTADSVKRMSPREQRPWNWRVLIGPFAYYRWLDRLERERASADRIRRATVGLAEVEARAGATSAFPAFAAGINSATEQASEAERARATARQLGLTVEQADAVIDRHREQSLITATRMDWDAVRRDMIEAATR